MKHILRLVFFSTLVLFSSDLLSSHIVGGYLRYECLGVVNSTMAEYKVTMYFYRDCRFGNDDTQPTSIPITVFNNRNMQIGVTYLTNMVSFKVIDPQINNPCIVPDTNVCVEEYVFQGNVTLNRNVEHTLVFQRCCKSDKVDNFPFPSDDYGLSYVAEVPPYNAGCNNTPIYNDSPPIYLCVGFDVNLDLSVSDIDGDSVAYSLCSIYSHNGTPLPIPANPPPYSFIPYRNPFSATNPLPASPGLSINSNGRLSGVPTSIGRYSLGLCVDEYRNGVLINTMRREVEVSTKVCDVIVNSSVQAQDQFCGGLTVQFGNNSTPNTINNYFWDFGVPGISSDTSEAYEPTYTYPAPGIYTITLISYPSFPACSSVTTSQFEVKKLIDPIIQTSGLICKDTNNVRFSVGGSYPDNTSFMWNFGGQASISTSTQDTVRNVMFNGPGPFDIQLISTEASCSDTLNTILTLKDKSTASFNLSDSAGCYPLPVNFTSAVSSSDSIIYNWDFGDGGTSNLPNPNHTYTANGYYDVSLTLLSVFGCLDTTIVKDSAVYVSLDSSMNNIVFDAIPTAGCAPLNVNFTNSSTFEGNADFTWQFGDGTSGTGLTPTHTYTENGYYDVSLEMITLDKCVDTLMIKIDSLIKVSLDSSLNDVVFDAIPTAGCAPLDVNFTNLSIYEGSADFTWQFGDGTSGTGLNQTHTYTENGYYDVSLEMITLDKCVDTLMIKIDSLIKVSLDSSQNEIDFDYFPKIGCSPLTVQFSDSSFYEGTADYFWDFGDGTLSTDQNPVKVYNNTGSYDVGLLLIPKDKCVDTLVKTFPAGIKVQTSPTAMINASDTALTLKEAMFTFTNDGSTDVSGSRYLINGTEVDTNDILTYQFRDTGHYQVSYIALNDVGCSDTSEVTVLVFDEFLFIIPNVFTPNGDRINDEFAMRACGVYEYEIDVFNRFGKKVFSSNSLNVNWDGRVGGRSANSGVYFYAIRIKDFRGEYLNYNGTVTLLRE